MSREAELEAIVEAAIEAVAQSLPPGAPALKDRLFYGALDVAPKHLAIWYVFLDNAGLERAKSVGLTGDILRSTREQLASRGYPPEVASTIGVAFTTDEDIRNSGLNFYQYFNGASPIMYFER